MYTLVQRKVAERLRAVREIASATAPHLALLYTSCLLYWQAFEQVV